MITILDEVLNVTRDNLITIVEQYFDSWDFPTNVRMDVHSADTGQDEREDWLCSFRLLPAVPPAIEIQGRCVDPQGFPYEGIWGILAIIPLNALSSRVKLAAKRFPNMLSHVFTLLGFHILKEIAGEDHADEWLASVTEQITGVSILATDTGSAEAGLDSLIRLIQKEGLGRKPESPLEMAAAWLAWHTTPKSVRPNLDTWLGDKFGLAETSALNLQSTTFHNYKRHVPQDRLSSLKEN